MSGIGVILGAGVYALIGPAAGLAGNALWLAFLLAAVAAGLTAYSYARLGAMRPKDSPEFNLSLPWVVSRGDKDPRVARRLLDLILPSLAFLMCGWLLFHTGWSSLAAAGGLAIVGLAVGHRRPNRGAAAPPRAVRQ